MTRRLQLSAKCIMEGYTRFGAICHGFRIEECDGATRVVFLSSEGHEVASLNVGNRVDFEKGETITVSDLNFLVPCTLSL